MSTRTKLFALAGTIGFVVAALVLMPRRPGPGRLLDGTRGALQEASYGTNHTSPKTPMEVLLRHLPSKRLEKCNGARAR